MIETLKSQRDKTDFIELNKKRFSPYHIHFFPQINAIFILRVGIRHEFTPFVVYLLSGMRHETVESV